MEKIDFVVTWVDGSDEKWLQEKRKYSEGLGFSSSVDNRKERYRDMGTLKYFFRGIAKFAPWVNKVYFITCGQKPEWLNEKCEKLVLVNHKDYIPEEYLPTFNSNTIEANMHEIKGLSEKFVYFNDDMFIVNPVSQEDFFKNGLPCDTLALKPIVPSAKATDGFFKMEANNMYLINKHFDFKQSFKKNWRKILSFKQGLLWLRTVTLCNYGCFLGFRASHLPVSYLKSTWKEVWEKEPEALKQTMSFRFRNNRDSVNHWINQYWQLASGNFEVRSIKFGRLVAMSDGRLSEYITGKKYKTLCINDEYDGADFEKSRDIMLASFEKKLPEKSMFEK